MFLPIAVYWIPLATALVGALTSNRFLLAAGLLTYLLQASLLLLVTHLRMCQLRWWKALFFPLAAIPVFCCFLKALYHRNFRGAVAWRGRVISVAR